MVEVARRHQATPNTDKFTRAGSYTRGGPKSWWHQRDTSAARRAPDLNQKKNSMTSLIPLKKKTKSGIKISKND